MTARDLQIRLQKDLTELFKDRRYKAPNGKMEPVHVFRQNLLIHQCVQRAAAVFPHVADPAAAVVDQAPVGAEMAFHLVAVAFFVESGFVHGRSFR